MDVCCECCVLSRRGLCDGPILRPEESHSVCVCVCVCVCGCVTECDQAQTVTLYTYSDFIERVQTKNERYAFYKRKSHCDEMGPNVQYYGLVL